jgi:hypothetical protein
MFPAGKGDEKGWQTVLLFNVVVDPCVDLRAFLTPESGRTFNALVEIHQAVDKPHIATLNSGL